MEQKNLILVGGGGHCKSVIEVAESAGYTILGIVDRPEELGKLVLDYKVIGVDDDIPQYVEKAEFVITVGFIKNPALRIKLYNKVKEAGGKLATIVASTAHVSKYATLGEGTVVMHQAFVHRLEITLSSIHSPTLNMMLSLATNVTFQPALWSMVTAR